MSLDSLLQGALTTVPGAAAKLLAERGEDASTYVTVAAQSTFALAQGHEALRAAPDPLGPGAPPPYEGAAEVLLQGTAYAEGPGDPAHARLAIYPREPGEGLIGGRAPIAGGKPHYDRAIVLPNDGASRSVPLPAPERESLGLPTEPLRHLRGDERIVLEGLHPNEPAITTYLPRARALAYVRDVPGIHPEEPLQLSPERLSIDTDRQTMTVFFRRRFQVPDEETLTRMRVVTGVESHGEKLDWPEPPPRQPVPLMRTGVATPAMIAGAVGAAVVPRPEIGGIAGGARNVPMPRGGNRALEELLDRRYDVDPAQFEAEARAMRDGLHQHLDIRIASEDFDTSHVQLFELRGVEALNQLFWFDLDVTSLDREAMAEDKIVGAIVTVIFEVRSGSSIVDHYRIHGMIASIDDHLDTETDYGTYRLRLVPRAHRSTLVEVQEVFLNKSVPDILREKLERAGLTGDDVELRLGESYPPREFVVQYRESDWAFICRLAEHYGITFFFDHAGDKDKLVFTDQNRFSPIEGDAAVAFRRRGERRDIHALSVTTKMIPASYLVQDYHYLTPQLDITGSHDLPDAYAGGVIEYGSHHATPGEGAALARVRAEERGATRSVIRGASDVVRLRGGARFTVEGHPKLGGVEIYVTHVEHHALQSALSHGADASKRRYENTFVALPMSVPFRPPRVTPKPKIVGVIPAVVEPHPDNVIGHHAEIDAMGRYTVRFFFDPSPLGARSKSTLPVRMAQPHAGPNYGFHFPLKPGIEVLVAFVEGDPDRPFIMASAPNPITPSPVAQHNYLFNKIETASGPFIEIKDV